VTAGIYVIFTLGLQLNVGYTGIVNFGQAGFIRELRENVALAQIGVRHTHGS
jgi:hypothetical protein